MQEIIYRLALWVILVNYYLNVAAAADSFSTIYGANKKIFSQLNGAHLKFAVANVNMLTVSMWLDNKLLQRCKSDSTYCEHVEHGTRRKLHSNWK